MQWYTSYRIRPRQNNRPRQNEPTEVKLTYMSKLLPPQELTIKWLYCFLHKQRSPWPSPPNNGSSADRQQGRSHLCLQLEPKGHTQHVTARSAYVITKRLWQCVCSRSFFRVPGSCRFYKSNFNFLEHHVDGLPASPKDSQAFHIHNSCSLHTACGSLHDFYWVLSLVRSTWFFFLVFTGPTLTDFDCPPWDERRLCGNSSLLLSLLHSPPLWLILMSLPLLYISISFLVSVSPCFINNVCVSCVLNC